MDALPALEGIVLLPQELTPDLRAQIHDQVFAPSLRMLLKRHAAHPSYPYPDTKFNPNTGRDLGAESYERLYTWILGRGAEACQAHLAVLDRIIPVTDPDYESIRALLERLAANCQAALLQILDRNGGRCPFIVNRHFEALDADGQVTPLTRTHATPADLFCAKGLLAAGDDAGIAAGQRLFHSYLNTCFDGRYAAGDSEAAEAHVSQGAFMLMLGAARLLTGVDHRAKQQPETRKWVERVLDHVLDTHYDASDGVFFEYADSSGRPIRTHCDPGHGIELCGLGLQALAACKDAVNEANHTRYHNDLAAILLYCFAKGFNADREGICKAFNPSTGEMIDSNMPWWNLPETVRAAAHVAGVAHDEQIRDRAGRILEQASEAYFAHYLNPEKDFFPYQTRSGETGDVADIVPAVPEGDPLYHANLAFLDVLDLL